MKAGLLHCCIWYLFFVGEQNWIQLLLFFLGPFLPPLQLHFHTLAFLEINKLQRPKDASQPWTGVKLRQQWGWGKWKKRRMEEEVEVYRRKKELRLLNRRTQLEIWFYFFQTSHILTGRSCGPGKGLSSQRRGWRRTAAGYEWSQLWPHHLWRFPAEFLTRCWSTTETCCIKDKKRNYSSRILATPIVVFIHRFIFLLLQLWRLFGCSGPRRPRDGAGLKGLAGGSGGWAGSLRRTLDRLWRRGWGGTVSPCGKREEVSTGWWRRLKKLQDFFFLIKCVVLPLLGCVVWKKRSSNALLVSEKVERKLKVLIQCQKIESLQLWSLMTLQKNNFT